MSEQQPQPAETGYSEQQNMRHAMSMLVRAVPPAEITASLVERGVNPISAQVMVEELLKNRTQARRSNALRGLVIGLVLIALGIYGWFAPMLLNPSSSKILAIAAVLYGLAQVVQGVVLLKK